MGFFNSHRGIKFKTMKKLTILSAIAMSGLIYSTANAQMSIRVGLHFGTPVAVQRSTVYDDAAQISYDGDDDYYYLPDVDAYYSVSEQCYYYFDGDSWISAAFLPGEYRDYNWRTARRYEVRAPRPYMHDEIYRSRYNGREVSAWAHTNNYEHYNAPVQRNYEERFDNRRQDNYRQSTPRTNDQRFENRRQGMNNQPAVQNNSQRWGGRAQGGYTQPAPQNNGQRFNNSEQGSTSQSARPGRGQRGNGQSSAQNGGEHYTQNSPRGGFSARTMTRF